MGKPGSSCLKIMACGRDPEAEGAADTEVAAAAEDKTNLSSDKRRWSFRRKSSRHRVLNNTSISESAVNINDATDASSNVVSSPSSLHNSDKPAPVKLVEEELQLPSSIISMEGKVLQQDVEAKATSDDVKDVACSVEEPLVIVIQTAVRMYLARKEFIKLKSVVMLQAVVRGHLVRRKAVGSLYCIQSIIKVQAVIRAHLMRSRKGDRAYRDERKLFRSNMKLLKNAFVQQLLDSITSEKAIIINCEPTKTDSTWLWLERWTVITSAHATEIQYLDSDRISMQESERPASSEVLAEVEVTDLSSAVNSKADICQIDSNISSNSCTNLKVNPPVSKPDESFEFRELSCNSVVSGGAVDSSADTPNAEEFSHSISSHSDGSSQPERQKRVVNLEKSKRTIKRVACEPQEAESKKVTLGSKRSRNPAFAAVQSKFEELSAPAPATSTKLVPRPAIIAEEKSDVQQSQVATLVKYDPTEACVTQPRVQTAISECGTEISITSTLDSPDRSEAEGGEIIMEIGDLEKRHFSPNDDAAPNLSNGIDFIKSDVTNPSFAIGKLEDKYNGVADAMNCNLEASEAELKDSCIGENLEEQEPKKSSVGRGLLVSPSEPLVAEQPFSEILASNVSPKPKSLTEYEVFMSSASPEGSPRSHITIPESHGTPSSQVSANTEKSKVSRKSRPQPHGKKSPSNMNGYAKNSIEHLPKDPKSAKRRNSLGTDKPAPVEHQPRNCSSNALPSYMQATKSARAKLQMHNSPKSSPDVHDTEIYTRKRHSLPLENGKHGSSPRMQRSTSQAQQSAKGNSTPSPHNSAERRWQR